MRAKENLYQNTFNHVISFIFIKREEKNIKCISAAPKNVNDIDDVDGGGGGGGRRRQTKRR